MEVVRPKVGAVQGRFGGGGGPGPTAGKIL